MKFTPEFETIGIEDVTALATRRKDDGWRYVQTLAVNTDDGVDVLYSFMDMTTGTLVNSTVKAVKPADVVPSITDRFLEAFVFENEIHDLFGVTFENIAIDFKGNFYLTAMNEPMTVISPEQKAAREKAAKVAAAKAAKEAKAAKADDGASTNELDAIEEKLKGMDPEKAAKVRAAMEAKAKKAAASKNDDIEEKLKGLDPEKAAKVRAAMEAKAKKAAAAGDDGKGA